MRGSHLKVRRQENNNILTFVFHNGKVGLLSIYSQFLPSVSKMRILIQTHLAASYLIGISNLPLLLDLNAVIKYASTTKLFRTEPKLLSS